MHEREYNKLKKQIEAEYRDKLRALETIWKMAGTSSTKQKASRVGSGDQSLAKAVSKSTKDMMGEFTVREVESKLAELEPSLAAGVRRTSISVVLKRMAGAGEICIVEPGRGKRATVYSQSDSKPAGPV